jgi:murein L,D-transpeptidase YafK
MDRNWPFVEAENGLSLRDLPLLHHRLSGNSPSGSFALQMPHLKDNDCSMRALRGVSRLNLRPFVRTLLASAAVAAAITLAGCDPDSIAPTGRSQAPLSEKMLSELDQKHMDKDSPILVRLYKEEAEMEVWKKDRDGQYALLKTYPICRWSGDLGPKVKEGDRQAPEGFYTITPGQMNPNSNYYLAFNTGYPNAYDRSLGHTGSELMVHGDCSSRGCYAMTDEQMVEIYALARESFFGGQKSFQFQAYPFRMTALNMAKHRNSPNYAFWKMLKVGSDHFEVTRQEPKVNVCEKRYVFDATAPDSASKPINFSPAGKCPIYQIDKSIADAVLEKRRKDETQIAEYAARGVATVPLHSGIDGGMNPVFATKLATHDVTDNDGRVQQVAGNTLAPGSLPRTSSPPLAPPVVPLAEPQIVAPEPVVLASVPVPRAAPQAKVGIAPPEQQPTTIAGLIGNIFSNPQPKAAEPQPETEVTTAEPVAETVPAPTPRPVVHHAVAERRPVPEAHPIAESKALALRGASDADVKPKQPVFRTAAVAPLAPWPEPAPAKPKAVANIPSEPAPQPKPAAKLEKPAKIEKAAKTKQKKDEISPTATHELRTAYSVPPASNAGLLSGAQPVVAAGSFSSR